MTAPAKLPLSYSKGRSLVDPPRVRLAGAGNLLLGLLGVVIGFDLMWQGGLRIFSGLLVFLIGLGFGWLGLLGWLITRFGNTAYHEIAPRQQLIVKLASVGFLFLLAVWLILSTAWFLLTKLVGFVRHAIGARRSA